MTHRVFVGAAVLEKAHNEFGEDRAAEGSPSEHDFVSGPLAAALLVFRDFENLSFDLVPAVRSTRSSIRSSGRSCSSAW
jgi:hypothetical protein